MDNQRLQCAVWTNHANGQVVFKDYYNIFFVFFHFEHLFSRWLTAKLAELCKSWIQRFLTITTQWRPNYIELKQIIGCSKFKSWILTLILLTPDALVTKRMNVFLRSKQLNVTIVEYRSYANSKRKVSFGRKERLARGHASGQSNENQTNTMIALTLCHCRPTKTPTGCCVYIIGVEVDFHFVCFGCYDRRLEVRAVWWISI